jgi:protein ImuA
MLVAAPTQFAQKLAHPISHPDVFRIGEIGTIAQVQTLPTGFAALDRELVGSGWPQPGLAELLCDDVGIGELSLLLPAHAGLSEACNLSAKGMLWVTPSNRLHSPSHSPSPSYFPYLPYAPALAQAGIDLKQLIIVKAAQLQEALWAAEQGLLSGSMGIVVVWLPDQQPQDVALRRLSQAANSSNALCMLMRPLEAAKRPSPAQLRIALRATAKGELELQLLKRRGLPMGKTIVLETRQLACLQREQTGERHRTPIAAKGWLQRLLTSTPVANVRQRSFEIDR